MLLGNDFRSGLNHKAIIHWVRRGRCRSAASFVCAVVGAGGLAPRGLSASAVSDVSFAAGDVSAGAGLARLPVPCLSQLARPCSGVRGRAGRCFVPPLSGAPLVGVLGALLAVAFPPPLCRTVARAGYPPPVWRWFAPGVRGLCAGSWRVAASAAHRSSFPLNVGIRPALIVRGWPHFGSYTYISMTV